MFIITKLSPPGHSLLTMVVFSVTFLSGTPGKVVCRIPFTGTKSDCHWWHQIIISCTVSWVKTGTMFALKAYEKWKVHQISFWVQMLYCHWRQTMDFVLSWQVYHLAFKLELFNILYVREFNDINCKDGKVLHIYLVSVRVY